MSMMIQPTSYSGLQSIGTRVSVGACPGAVRGPYRGLQVRWLAERRQRDLERSSVLAIGGAALTPGSIEEELEFCAAAGKDARSRVKRKLEDVVKAFNVERGGAR